MVTGCIRIVVLTIFCVNLVYTQQVYADDGGEDPEQLFNRAVELFKSKRYTQAIELFVAAKQQGMTLAKLHFNLGSAYYKISQFQQALSAFTIAAKDNKLEVLARINMALCLAKLSRTQAAQQQLQRVTTLTNNAKYLYLVKRIADKYKLLLPKQYRSSYWQTEYSVFYGVNDNVVLQNDLDVKTQGDFTQTSMSTTLQAKSFFSVRLALQSTSYSASNLSQYNYIQANIEPELRVENASWRYSLTTIYQPSSLAGKLYLNTSELRNTLRYQIQNSIHLEASVSVYEYANRSTASEYLSGHAIRRGLLIGYQTEHVTMSVSGHSQAENRSDSNPLDPSRSYSPRRRELALNTRTIISPGNLLSLSAQYRRSKYPFNNRVDSRQSASIHFTHKIKYSYWISITLNYIDNDSDNIAHDSPYSYQSSSYLIGLSHSF